MYAAVWNVSNSNRPVTAFLNSKTNTLSFSLQKKLFAYVVYASMVLTRLNKIPESPEGK